MTNNEIGLDKLAYVGVKPVLKWAGGKTQILPELLPRMPSQYGKYIEPFFGGGALFFAAPVQNAIIADSNPELVLLYQTLKDDPEGVIAALRYLEPNKDEFLRIQAQDWMQMEPAAAAARTIYLNRTCFNGLYRVNRQGQFNVPFGRYKNPTICNAEGLSAASLALQRAQEIVQGDYLAVLQHYAEPGDFIFLDPPYIPVSAFSDFKRYTKEQFYEADHRRLAEEVARLHELGCTVVLTNSDHPLVHELYGAFNIKVIETRRNINKKGNSRTGKDVIVTAIPRNTTGRKGKKKAAKAEEAKGLPPQVKLYPSTRYMGSKEKLLPHIWEVAKRFDARSVIDLFAGSGVVSYMFKTQGLKVITNDYMAMSTAFGKAMIENNDTRLCIEEVELLLTGNYPGNTFVSETFNEIYFSQVDNQVIDRIRANMQGLDSQGKRAIAMAALIRACMKKRPRGIFTYVGQRYDDGRNDIRLALAEHFRNAVEIVNAAVFDNGQQNVACNGDAMAITDTADIVYMDPPYYSPLGDNEYVRRYHFVEGLARNWERVEIQQNTKTKKFKNYPTPFKTEAGTIEAFNTLFDRFRDSIIIVSYSSNSLPGKDAIVELMRQYKENVEVVEVPHRYSFGNQNHKVDDNKNVVKEYLFVGYSRGDRR